MNSTLKKKPDIIIVDDHLIFRQGLKAIINFENIGSIIGEASNGEEFIELLATVKPDLVLMDIDMPQMNGIEATQKALAILPELKIIAFTVFSEDEYRQKMMDLGAKGFILKSDGFNELENAINLVMKGESYFTNAIQNDTKNKVDKNEDLKTTENPRDSRNRKGKLLFFPWVVNRKSCVNS